jgi:hypothetical protein
MVVKVVNDTTRPNSLIPTLLIFRAYPRVYIDSPPILTTLKQAEAIQKVIKKLRKLLAKY